jgi:hypothetical protein
MNTAFNRSYNISYTITTDNTWEKKIFTIPGDTGATSINTTTGIAISLVFDLGFSPMYESATANAWQGSSSYALSGCTKLSSTVGATFYLTGLQLEVGSTATDFERRPIGTELALCQRYFEKSVGQAVAITASGQNTLIANVPSASIGNGVYYYNAKFLVTKRTSPTLTTYPYTTPSNTTALSNDVGTDFAANSAQVGVVSDSMFAVKNQSGATITTGAQLIIIGNWYASAEL